MLFSEIIYLLFVNALMLLMFDTAEDLRMVFSSFGRIQNVWVAQNPPGYAFVGFENEIDAQLAWQQMDGQHLHNRRIKVNTSFRHNQKRSLFGFRKAKPSTAL